MKRLAIKVGEYQKDGQTKGEYVKVGVLMSNDNGEYILLDPSVNLAGCLLKQRIMNSGKQTKGKGDMVMCSVFEQQQQQAAQQQTAPDFNDDIPF